MPLPCRLADGQTPPLPSLVGAVGSGFEVRSLRRLSFAASGVTALVIGEFLAVFPLGSVAVDFPKLAHLATRSAVAMTASLVVHRRLPRSSHSMQNPALGQGQRRRRSVADLGDEPSPRKLQILEGGWRG